jgi:ribosomal protein S18 acetylase RimI-like enzyme
VKIKETALHIEPAKLKHAESLVELINGTYRGESSRLGWTTEADLLEGLRTDLADITRLLTSSDSIILIAEQDQQLIGSVHLQHNSDYAQLGMLSVKPTLQNQGIGKQLISAAEAIAQQQWEVNRMRMAVIPSRETLIAYYQRRGYVRTGETIAFPVNPALWTPKVSGLCLEWLEKLL